MKTEKFEVIIIGGSYSGLSAAMALGRALRKVLVVDAGRPANRFTPHSHNFITHDGSTPAQIAAIARGQVQKYESIQLKTGVVARIEAHRPDFVVSLDAGHRYSARKVILATGIIDLMPGIPGFAECWGKTVLHCPYCHGYEVRNTKTGILGNGDYAFEFGAMISNWTNDLRIYTNGPSTLTAEQTSILMRHKIAVVEDRVKDLSHTGGSLQEINFENGMSENISTLYSKLPFVQQSELLSQLGCELTDEGYIKVDQFQKTTIPGVFACGDNATKIRTVANAVSLGTTAGIMTNKELIFDDFN
jgi:thioredoxin reductase